MKDEREDQDEGLFESLLSLFFSDSVIMIVFCGALAVGALWGGAGYLDQQFGWSLRPWLQSVGQQITNR